jgi:hypothetical protein
MSCGNRQKRCDADGYLHRKNNNTNYIHEIGYLVRMARSLISV